MAPVVLSQSPENSERSPLLRDKPGRSSWNGLTIELSPQTKTVLKLAALAIGAIFVMGLGAGLFFCCPLTLPVMVISAVLFGAGFIGLLPLTAKIGIASRELKDAKDYPPSIAEGLANTEFLQMLFDFKQGAQGSSLFLMIIANVLESKDEYREKYAQAIKELREAANAERRQDSLGKDRSKEAQKIYDHLKSDEVHVAELRGLATATDFRGHYVGCRFSKNPKDPNSIIYSIFNTGCGLGKNHFYARYTDDKGVLVDYKPDLQASWEIPLSQLTPELIERLLDPSTPIQERYESCNKLAGEGRLDTWKKIIYGQEVRVQRSQKSGNCTIEWIFAYLKLMMTPQDYYEMRRELFEAAIREGLKNPETRAKIRKNWDSIQKRIERKRAKAAVAKKIVFPQPLQFSEAQIEPAFQEARQAIDPRLEEKAYKHALLVHVTKKLGVDLDHYFDYDHQMFEEVEKVVANGDYRPQLKDYI